MLARKKLPLECANAHTIPSQVGEGLPRLGLIDFALPDFHDGHGQVPLGEPTSSIRSRSPNPGPPRTSGASPCVIAARLPPRWFLVEDTEVVSSKAGSPLRPRGALALVARASPKHWCVFTFTNHTEGPGREPCGEMFLAECAATSASCCERCRRLSQHAHPGALKPEKQTRHRPRKPARIY